jgi:sortase (surface protein transpeptidase)
MNSGQDSEELMVDFMSVTSIVRIVASTRRLHVSRKAEHWKKEKKKKKKERKKERKKKQFTIPNILFLSGNDREDVVLDVALEVRWQAYPIQREQSA